MHRIYSVFRDDLDPDDDVFFDELAAAFDDLALFGYHFEFESDEAFDKTLQLVWAEVEELATASVIKERETGMCYLVITAGRRSDARLIQQTLAKSFDFAELEDLQRQAEKQLLWHPIWLVKMALAASHRRDAHSVELIRGGLSHRSPNVRFHAALAAAHTRWSVLVPDLERLLKGEPDARTRQMAARALDLCLPRQ